MTSMTEAAAGIRIRPLDELDISEIVAIDEAISGHYRPEVWERRIGYYLRRAPPRPPVAPVERRAGGIILAEARDRAFGVDRRPGRSSGLRCGARPPSLSPGSSHYEGIAF